MSSAHRSPFVVLGAILMLTLLGGCENWPRYLHLDDDPGAFVITERVVVYEDESLDGEQIQDAGEVASGTEILYYGYSASCGYDDTASWPEWPEHDLDGDGTPDGPLHAGWFAGDVDWLGFTVSGEVMLEGTLAWANAPDGSSNAPWEPGNPTGAWATESDLDVVLFVVDGADRTIVDETGISNDYPEQIQPEEAVADGAEVAVAVACHHEIPTDFDLRIVVK